MASISFDRGFWYLGNFDVLSGLDVQVILPKKGNKNKAEKERESDPEFQEKRRRHAGIESCNSMVRVVFVRKEAWTGLHERSEQVWLRPICVG